MGCCISKCKPNMMKQPARNLDLNNSLVVIPKLPQPPFTKITPNSCTVSLNNKISPYPPSPSNSSVSSFTTTTTTTSSSASSTSSVTSRSPIFSDHYLWSSYKQNPHLLRIHSLKANAALLSSRLNSPPSAVLRHPSPQRVSTSTPRKRVRPASPSPARQKSFRKVERPPSPSPSPSRRVGPTTAAGERRQLPDRRGNCGVMKKEITCIHRISSKIDEVAVGKAVLANQDFDSVVAMEDFENPLISLDCFIFL